jgi:hypothetical protein
VMGYLGITRNEIIDNLLLERLKLVELSTSLNER